MLMVSFTNSLKREIDQSLQEISLSDGDTLKKAGEVTLLLKNAFDQLRTFILAYQFKDEDEEILFFKDIKPNLFCNLIYYCEMYNIEINRPTGGEVELKCYLEKELRLLKDYFDRNKSFYCYYRSGETDRDRYFFLRGKSDNILYHESFSFERDPRFSTICDFKMMRILANEKIENYILAELTKLKEPQSMANTIHLPKVKLTWTVGKIFLIELIYALYLFGAFNHRKATLKQIFSYFEDVFNVDLGANPSKAYTEMRERKQRTTFLDKLKEILTKKMDEDDQK